MAVVNVRPAQILDVQKPIELRLEAQRHSCLRTVVLRDVRSLVKVVDFPQVVSWFLGEELGLRVERTQ